MWMWNRVARRGFLAGGLAVTAVGVCGVPAVASRRSGSAEPSISSTSDWDARDASGAIDVVNSKPTKIVVHHTATPNGEDTSQEQAFAVARQIQDFHMDSNGWVDTGQNFTNSRGGYLMEGRHQSLSALESGSRHVVGAHAGEQNSVSLGIENEGTYSEVGAPAALWASLVRLCTYMVAQYGIDAGEIYGHRDFMSTGCPGDVLYERLPELRQEVGAAFGQVVADPVVWPLLRSGSRGPVVSALQLLLRSGGAQLPVDGVFGARTGQVAAGMRSGEVSCFATRVAEPEVFGGQDWARVVPEVSGGSGDAVRAVQVLVTWRGFAVDASGRFDEATAAAVRRVQAAAGLPVSGVVDRATWLRLLAR